MVNFARDRQLSCAKNSMFTNRPCAEGCAFDSCVLRDRTEQRVGEADVRVERVRAVAVEAEGPVERRGALSRARRVLHEDTGLQVVRTRQLGQVAADVVEIVVAVEAEASARTERRDVGRRGAPGEAALRQHVQRVGVREELRHPGAPGHAGSTSVRRRQTASC